jgi:hypothetical protein
MSAWAYDYVVVDSPSCRCCPASDQACCCMVDHGRRVNTSASCGGCRAEWRQIAYVVEPLVGIGNGASGAHAHGRERHQVPVGMPEVRRGPARRLQETRHGVVLPVGAAPGPRHGADRVAAAGVWFDQDWCVVRLVDVGAVDVDDPVTNPDKIVLILGPGPGGVDLVEVGGDLLGDLAPEGGTHPAVPPETVVVGGELFVVDPDRAVVCLSCTPSMGWS